MKQISPYLVLFSALSIGLFFCSPPAEALPFPDPTRVPQDIEYSPLPRFNPRKPALARGQAERGLTVLRVGVRFDARRESYEVTHTVQESTGTAALRARALQKPRYGSYIGVLRNRQSGAVLGYDNIGTGKEYRLLADEITFRFPLKRPMASDENLEFELIAENSLSGVMESVLRTPIQAESVQVANPTAAGVEIREIKRAQSAGNELRMNIYSEGYTEDRREIFWKDAERAVAALVKSGFPMVDRLHFFAVFGASTDRLGGPARLGPARASRDTFLNLFFPYWDPFGRWHDVVYPASEERFRLAVGVAPYDYILAIADESSYWGIGNFRVLTAVPARNSSFIYLLLHEMGHFFGLNEEYDEGGRTELEFAPGIAEPWSQNITFHPLTPKWTALVQRDTPLPTPDDRWTSRPPLYGAYVGGYAESPPLHRSHKPGLDCLMDHAKNFCAVCRNGISDVMRFDTGAR